MLHTTRLVLRFFTIPFIVSSYNQSVGMNSCDARADLNGDNIVDIADFGLLVNAYGSSLFSGNYDYHADFNSDGTVDIADFGLLVNNYGASGDN